MLLYIPQQKRRIARLQMLFGWNIHYVDVTNCLQCAFSFLSPNINLNKKPKLWINFTPSISINFKLPVSTGASDDSWSLNVVKPSVNIVKSFLDITVSTEATKAEAEERKLAERDLWTRYICEVSHTSSSIDHFAPDTEL